MQIAPADPHARIHPLGPLLLGATVAALLLDPRLAPLPAMEAQALYLERFKRLSA